MENVTLEKLTKAFELWIDGYRQNPNEYADESEMTVNQYASLSAEHLLKLLKEVQ